MYLGAHVFASGGFHNCLKTADELEINTIQAMFSAPMRWSTQDIKDEYISKFAEYATDTGVRKVLFHGIYLINLARKEKQKFHLSKVSLMTHLSAVDKLERALIANVADVEILGLTFHAGSAIDLTPEEGLERIIQGLDWVMDRVERGMVLLETSAGAGNVMGDTFEELAAMRDGAKHKDRIAYVVDTQHTFVSGYDWVNDLDGVISQMDKTLGLDKVKAIHLNDSMKPFNSHKDRHSDLGEGEIGRDAISKILRHPKLRDIPFILETPSLKDIEEAKKEVGVMKELAGET